MRTEKSIVLVTVDCLRADHVGFGGYDRPTTPFLDGLAGESFIFPAAIVAGAPTYYSFPAILGARPPLALGRDILGLAPGEPTLASALKQAGYATAAFSAANPYLSSRFGYDQGFDVFRDFLSHDVPDSESSAGNRDGNRAGDPEKFAALHWTARFNRRLQKASRGLGPLARVYDELYFQYCQRWALPRAQSLDSLRRFPAADVLVEQAKSWLASVGGQPFLLWLHLMDPHAPYYPAAEALELMGGVRVSPNRARYLNSFWQRDDSGPRALARHRDDIIRLYDAGIRWVDAQMASLIAALRGAGLWENCIFALTADHGEEFLDHGGRYHSPGLMEELIRVPLLLRVPGVASKDLTNSPFSLMDLSPTLFEAADVKLPAIFQGSSRWQEIRQGLGWDQPAVVECVAGCTNPFYTGNRLGPRVLVMRDARYKLVLDFEPSGERLYDLEADPREQAPLSPATGKAIRRRLLECARRHLEHSLRERDAAPRLQARLGELRLEWAEPMTPTQTAGF